jgi:hypothetical protein
LVVDTVLEQGVLLPVGQAVLVVEVETKVLAELELPVKEIMVEQQVVRLDMVKVLEVVQVL